MRRPSLLALQASLTALVTLLFPAHVVCAADTARTELGRPLMANYSPRQYQGHNQVFGGFQAEDGLFYFVNGGQVLRFDGENWERIPVPSPYVRGIVAGQDNRIYIGAVDEFGYLRTRPDGSAEYVSLKPSLPPDLQNIGPVWATVRWDDSILFATPNRVLRWRSGKIDTIAVDGTPRHILRNINNVLWQHVPGRGLFYLEQNRFTPVPVPREFVETSSFLFTAGPEAGTYLVGVDSGRLYLWREGETTAKPWDSEADALLRTQGLFGGNRLKSGNFLLTTRSGTVMLVSPQGKLLRFLDADSGLDPAQVYGISEDRHGAVWLGSSKGVYRIELESPFTVFDRLNGRVRGEFFDTFRLNGTLHTYTVEGLYRLRAGNLRTPEHARWERLPGPPTMYWNVSGGSDRAIVASDAGLMEFDGEKQTLIERFPTPVVSFVWSVSDAARLFVGTGNHLVFLKRDASGWRREGEIPGVGTELRMLLETPDGTLWGSGHTRGFFRINRPAGSDDWTRATVKSYHGTHGLPAAAGICELMPTPAGPLFVTEKGVFRFDAAREAFTPDPRFQIEGRSYFRLSPFSVADSGDVWGQVTFPDGFDNLRIGRLRFAADGSLTWTELPRRLVHLCGARGAYGLTHEKNGDTEVLWASGQDNMVRVDLGRVAYDEPRSDTKIRGFRLGDQPLKLAPSPDGAPLVPHSHEPLRIAFSGLAPRLGSTLEYQTRLLGFANEWSGWSRHPEATFTNLSGGPFTFEVRARDEQRRVGAAAQIVFSVRPPWYLHGAALFGYVVAGLALVGSYVQMRVRSAERKRLALEKIVAERTAELKVAKDAADEANRAKSTFLANMSHELRTPLNGVIGYAQVLMKDRELSEKNRERLRIVQTSGEHLLRMINEVLDFSKIEAGKMELITTPFHLPQLLRDIAAAVSPRFEQKGLELVFDPAPDLPDLVLGDPQKLRQVIDNLLGNAAKFTERGTVRFRAQLSGLETVEFSVTDTGVGIAAQDIGRLFQPFQQAVDGRPPEPGTGLGLAISQRLVTLMGSRLGVESQPGQGSRFFFAVELPVLAVDATAQRTETQAIVGYRGARRHLLIVDDVATNRHVLRDLLTPLGFTISEAAGGTEALAVVPQVQPELIFLDLRMPGIDGFELARRLRERPGGKEMKIFAMSASVLSFNREKAFAAGCDDFLPKPFREEDLLSRLGLALQLEWVRDAEAPAARPASRSPFPSLTTQLPTAIVEDLLAIARRGEIAALRRRLDELKGDPLVDSLDVFVKTYRMERIREVLERHLSSPPPAS